jgi:hypothetical protein
MFGLLVKTFTMFITFTGISAQTPQQMVGGQKDVGGCYTSAGFEWCDSLDRCVRPWVNSCPPPSPPMLAPSPPTREPPPLILGEVCKSGGVETGKGVHRMNDCPSGSKCSPSKQMAIGGESPWLCKKELSKEDKLKNCKTWYDGCNNCFVQDGQIAGCTKMYCFQQGEAKCLVENDSH